MDDFLLQAVKAVMLKRAADLPEGMPPPSSATNLGHDLAVGGGLAAGAGYGGHALATDWMNRNHGSPLEAGIAHKQSLVNRVLSGQHWSPRGEALEQSIARPRIPETKLDWAALGRRRGIGVGKAGLGGVLASLPLMLLGGNIDRQRQNAFLAQKMQEHAKTASEQQEVAKPEPVAYTPATKSHSRGKNFWDRAMARYGG